MRATFLVTLLTLILPVFFVQAQTEPQVKVNHFQNLPARLYFFDDATVRARLFISRDTCRP